MKAEEDASDDKWILFDDNIYKLHGDMDHSERKKNYFGFDKAESSLLICTDVAARGIDVNGLPFGELQVLIH